MTEKFLYYIGIRYFDSKTQKLMDRPRISKIKSSSKLHEFSEREMEGPFKSISVLKKDSKIYSKINCDRIRQSILKPENIKEIEKITLVPFEHAYEPKFIKLFLHTWIGKIAKKDISGVHFYNAENVKILQIIDRDETTGIYKAMISYFDQANGRWIEKSKPSNFFPDNWTIQKLFKELDCAYQNKKHETGSTYYGFTSELIKVKIIIKGNDALTMYPMM